MRLPRCNAAQGYTWGITPTSDTRDSALIQVTGLTKSYGDFPAVKGIDFEVRAGEVFGLLGPNGAGQTTTVEILEGLRPRSGGEVSVLGFDPGAQSKQLKNRIGVCLWGIP
jgi:ABC-2 type transport system ATP-binding protein